MIRAKFFDTISGAQLYEADVAAIPEVGESVMLVSPGLEDGPIYRVLKRDWKLVPYVGFDNKTYTNTEVFIYVEEG